MAVFRVTTVRYLDADGKRVRRKADWDKLPGQVATRFYDSHGKLTRAEPKDDPEGPPRKTKAIRVSKKWYGDFTGADGFKNRIALFTDQAASERELQDRQTHADKERKGLAAPREQEQHARRPLSEHLADYCEHLARDGKTPEHVAAVKSDGGWILREGKFTAAADVTHAKVLACIDTLRRRGRVVANRKPKGAGAKTCQGYLRRFSAFCSWLVKERRAPYNPLARIGYAAKDDEPRHPRRPLDADEFARLVAAAEASRRTVESIDGRDRAMLYVLAAWTGFRRGELGSLTIRSFNLDAEAPTVRVKGKHTKNRDAAEIPLHPSIVAWVRAWLADKGAVAGDTLLLPVGRCHAAASIGRGRGRAKNASPRRWGRKTSEMMRVDLELARAAWVAEAATEGQRKERESSDFLAYLGEDGLYADFHSNRMRFVTELARSGVLPTQTKELARHADMRTTLNSYTRLGLADKRSGIDALPDAPRRSGEPPEAQEGRLTGTDGASTSGASADQRERAAARVAVRVAVPNVLDVGQVDEAGDANWVAVKTRRFGPKTAQKGPNDTGGEAPDCPNRRDAGARDAGSHAAQVEPECDLVSALETTTADNGSADEGWLMGLEPTTPRSTIWCSNRLSYSHRAKL